MDHSASTRAEGSSNQNVDPWSRDHSYHLWRCSRTSDKVKKLEIYAVDTSLVTLQQRIPDRRVISMTKAKLDYSLYLVTGRELLPPGKVSSPSGI